MPVTAFAVTRQDKPDNCSAVAFVNAMRWIGAPRIPDVEQLEKCFANGAGGDKGRYVRSADWIRTAYWLDVMLLALKPSQWTDETIGRVLADGWVLVTGLSPVGRSGDRHAVAVVAPGLAVLDGLRSGEPLTMPCEEFRQRHATETMALRLPRW